MKIDNSSEKMKVLFSDEYIVVIEKASGFLSVPGRGPEKLDSVSWRIKNMFEGCIDQPAVHRLDMDTSGLLVLARTKSAHRNISIQFQNRTVIKKYEALLEGIIDEQSGKIELPFRLDIENRPHQIYDPIHGKIGITNWHKLGIEANYTRLEFEPLTGRTHQLRVHAVHDKGLGIPIVGDPLYGNGTGAGQLKLHAKYLEFNHPESEERIHFESFIPF